MSRAASSTSPLSTFSEDWVTASLRAFKCVASGALTRRYLAPVDSTLRSTPALGEDLRRKILQSRDELARTVAIRRRYR